MNQEDITREAHWLTHLDEIDYMKSDAVVSPWFPALKIMKSPREDSRWFSALVPVSQIPILVDNSHGWDIGPAEGAPSVWTHYDQGEMNERRYCVYGNGSGIEPLVFYRTYHGLRPDDIELAQEIRLYHNLFHDSKRKRYLKFDLNGDESEVVRYGENFVEIRTDLLRRFCDTKQMALAVYFESFRYSEKALADLGLSEQRDEWKGERYNFRLAIVPEDGSFGRQGIESCRLVVGAKKYILPGEIHSDAQEERETYQEFIIKGGPPGQIHQAHLQSCLFSRLFRKKHECTTLPDTGFFPSRSAWEVLSGSGQIFC